MANNPKELKSINDALTKMLELTGKLQKEFEGTSKTMVDGLNAVDKAAKDRLETNKKANATRKEGREQISLEQKEAQNLVKAKNDLKQAQLKQSELTLRLKKQRQDLIKQQKLAIQASKGEAKTYEQLSARYRRSAQSAKDLAVQYGANSKKARAAIKEAKNYNKELKKVDASLGNHQRNVGNYGSAMGSLPGPIGGVISSIKMLTKVIFATPLGWLIGLIAGAGAALKTFFTGSVEGQQRWTETMAKAKGVASVFKDELINVGKKLSDFTRNLKESEGGVKGWAASVKDKAKTAWQDFKEDVADEGVWETLKDRSSKAIDNIKAKSDELRERIEENTARALVIANKQNDLRFKQIDLMTEEGQILKDVAELRAKAADKENVSAFDRITLLDQAIQKQNELLSIQEEVARERIAIQKLEMEQGENTIEDYEELAKLERALIDLQTANAEKRRRFTSEQLSSVRELKAELKAFADTVEKEADASLAEVGKENEKWLNDFESELEKAMDNEYDVLMDGLERQEDARVEAGETEIENFKNKEEQKKEAAVTAGQLILDTLTQFANQRIELAEMEIQAAEAQVSAAENNLNRQVALAEAGYANNVQQAQKDLTLAKNTQNKALEEKKRAVEQKQKLETIEQGISIITAVANIIQGFSSIPIVGWVLGIAAGAAMIAAYAQQRRQAKQATTQSFGEGGVIDLEGGSHASGNDIHFGNKNGVELRAEGKEKAAIFSRKASRRYGSTIDSFVNAANNLQLEEKYSKAFSLGAMPIVVHNDSGFDDHELKQIKRVLKSIEKQGSSASFMDSKGRVVQKKGNVTRVVKHG